MSWRSWSRCTGCGASYQVTYEIYSTGRSVQKSSQCCGRHADHSPESSMSEQMAEVQALLSLITLQSHREGATLAEGCSHQSSSRGSVMPKAHVLICTLFSQGQCMMHSSSRGHPCAPQLGTVPRLHHDPVSPACSK